jgi:uncharacterized membrane protein YfcA
VRPLLASPLGFLIGLSLGAFGGGGSVLAVPALVYGAGQSAQAATATSLVLVGTAALLGMVAQHRAGQVHVRIGLVFALAGVPGSIAGTALNRGLDPNVLLLGFSILALVAAWRMAVGCPTCTKVGEAEALRAEPEPAAPGGIKTGRRVDARTVLAVAAVGTAVGFLSGLFGVGGGFIVVPALTLVLALSMRDAIGTSLLVIAVNSAVALLLRLGHSTIDWRVTIPFTVAAVAGVLTGTRIGRRLDPEVTTRWFAAMLVVVALYTAFRSLEALAG